MKHVAKNSAFKNTIIAIATFVAMAVLPTQLQAADPTPADITDLILVTGQSNVRGSQTDYDPTVDGTHPRVFAFNTTRVTDAYSTGGTWQLADLHQAWDVDGWHPGNGSLNDSSRTPYNNFAFHFAKTLADSDPTKVVGIVIASAPGEGIQHWDVAGDFAGPDFPDNRTFAEVVETQALAALNAQGVKTSFDAVLWHQGETDWQKEGTSDPDVLNHFLNDSSYNPALDTTYYPDKLNALINRFRSSNWFTTGKPFICGETKRALVNERLMDLNTDGNPWTGCVVGNDLSTRDATANHGGTHFDAQGLRTLGQRYGQKYLEMTTGVQAKAGTIKIMAVGDSITEGYTPADSNGNVPGTPSYRQEFATLLSNAGCDFEMVGRKNTNHLDNNPANTFFGNHEGYSGQRANHILNSLNWDSTNNAPTAGAGSWSNPGIAQMMLDDDPDVVLLHIGTNDLRGGESAASTASEIQQVINTIQSGTNANTIVLLANIIPHYTNTQWNPNVNQSINDLANQLNNIYNNPDNPVPNVHLVDVSSGYIPSYMQDDEVHPNANGEAHIADAFFDAIETHDICGGSPLIDTIAPTTTINVPSVGQTMDATATFSGTAADQGGSGIAEVWIAVERTSDGQWFNFDSGGFGPISVNGVDVGIANATLANNTGDSADWSIGVTLPADDYRLYALAIDGAGNDAFHGSGLSVWPVSRDFPVSSEQDITNPSITIATMLNGSSTTISGSVVDESAIPVNRLLIHNQDKDEYWNGNFWVSDWAWFTISSGDTWIYTLYLPAGNYVSYAWAWDTANNVGRSEAQSFSISESDTTDPTVVITSPREGSTNNSPVIFEGTSTDQSDILLNRMLILNTISGRYWDGAAWVNSWAWFTTGNGPNWSYTLDLPEGNFVTYGWAWDSSGNKGRSAIRKFSIGDPDETAPIVTFASPTDGSIQGSPLEFTVTVSDQSEIIQNRMMILNTDSGDYWDGNAWVSAWTWFETDIDNIWTHALSLPQSNFIAYSWAWDSAGNRGRSAVLTFTISE